MVVVDIGTSGISMNDKSHIVIFFLIINWVRLDIQETIFIEAHFQVLSINCYHNFYCRNASAMKSL